MDGYITRFKPNLVRADGTRPAGRAGPPAPRHVAVAPRTTAAARSSPPARRRRSARGRAASACRSRRTDQWLLLYMVHSAVSQPMETYITYEIDFVPKAEAEAARASSPRTRSGSTCGPPATRSSTSSASSAARTTSARGRRRSARTSTRSARSSSARASPATATGEDFELPKQGEPFGKIEKFTGGTLIGIGGHLHPGGLTNDIDLVRPGGEDGHPRDRRAVHGAQAGRRAQDGLPEAARQALRDARASRASCARASSAAAARQVRRRSARSMRTRRDDRVPRAQGRPSASTRRGSTPAAPGTGTARTRPSRAARRPRGTSRWRSRACRTGASTSSPATSCAPTRRTTRSSRRRTRTWASRSRCSRPTRRTASRRRPGVNPFQAERDDSKDCASGGVTGPDKKLCTVGLPTHGHYKENGNYGGPGGTWDGEARASRRARSAIAELPLRARRPVDAVDDRRPAGQARLEAALHEPRGRRDLPHDHLVPVPVPRARPARRSRCPTARRARGAQVDIDSSELGFGTPGISAPKQALDYELPVTKEEGYKPGETVTYFCRVHPFMRGAFEVKE